MEERRANEDVALIDSEVHNIQHTNGMSQEAITKTITISISTFSLYNPFEDYGPFNKHGLTLI